MVLAADPNPGRFGFGPLPSLALNEAELLAATGHIAALLADSGQCAHAVRTLIGHVSTGPLR